MTNLSHSAKDGLKAGGLKDTDFKGKTIMENPTLDKVDETIKKLINK